MDLWSLWPAMTWIMVLLNSIHNSSTVDVLGSWLEWSPWTICTETIYCFEGSRQRERHCEKDKRCVGIEEESEGCPNTSCVDRPVYPDLAHAGPHSFIQEECLTSKKYLASGRFASLLRHNITRIFPKSKGILNSSYFNLMVTRKKLHFEEDIYKYCFEPRIKMNIKEFVSLFNTGELRFKFTSIYCPLPGPREARHVTGIVIGVQESGELYAIYAQVTAEKGFRSIFYKRMPGSYTDAYNLNW